MGVAAVQSDPDDDHGREVDGAVGHAEAVVVAEVHRRSLGLIWVAQTSAGCGRSASQGGELQVSPNPHLALGTLR